MRPRPRLRICPMRLLLHPPQSQGGAQTPREPPLVTLFTSHLLCPALSSRIALFTSALRGAQVLDTLQARCWIRPGALRGAHLHLCAAGSVLDTVYMEVPPRPLHIRVSRRSSRLPVTASNFPQSSSARHAFRLSHLSPLLGSEAPSVSGTASPRLIRHALSARIALFTSALRGVQGSRRRFGAGDGVYGGSAAAASYLTFVKKSAASCDGDEFPPIVFGAACFSVVSSISTSGK